MRSRSDSVASEVDVLVRLPDEHREAFKDALGPIYSDAETLLAAESGPIVTVGDVVSYHFERVERVPDVAVIDGRTKRTAVDPEIEAALERSRAKRIHATNPPGTLTISLLRALAAAFDGDVPVQVVVDGEEDLATVPAILLSPPETNVIYGQPEEGMVHVRVTPEAKTRARSLLEKMTGDHDRLAAILDE